MATVGALASAVAFSIALCWVGVFGPPGAAIALVVTPLPLLVLGSIGGTAAAAVAAFLSAVLLASTVGTVAGALYMVAAAVPMVVAVWALRSAWRIEAVIGAALAAFVVGVGLLLWAQFGDLAAVQAAVTDAWRQSFNATVTIYQQMGVSPERISEIEAGREELEHGTLALLPGIVAVSAAVVYFVNILCSRRWAAWPQLGALARWQAPQWVIWAFIFSGFSMFAPMEAVSLVARNLFLVFLVCYFFQGLAIVSYFLERFNLPRGLRLASYLLIGVQQFVAGAVLALGVFDLWGDFRRLSAHPVDAKGRGDRE